MYLLRFIGSKVNLLNEIHELLNKHTYGSEETFLDIFAGSNAVSNYFKNHYTVYSNDMLYFSFVLAKANIENNNPLYFDGLKKLGINDPIDFLQNSDLDNSIIGYYEENYSPSGSKGRMYFSTENAKRIDFVRDTVDNWFSQNYINENEYYYLLSSLIESIPFISNITGTYGAYLKKWDKRALKSLSLKPLGVINNNRNNRSYNMNANELIKNISADILYIDPPYNKRQYAPNYHVLENIAKNDKPNLKGVTGLMDYKDLKSSYSVQKTALSSLEDLINNADATHIILSYNNEGLISEEFLLGLMKRYSINNTIDVKRIPYRKYKSKIPSKSYDLYEILIYIQKKPEVTTSKNTDIVNTKTWKISNKYLKSPLNYVGGKHKLLKQILPLFPEDINTFIDLFSGGANVGINVNANKYIFNDMNYRINEMFRYFSQQDPDDLIKKIEDTITKWDLSKTNQDAYLNFRDHYNSNPNPLDLYVLISYSYNYQIRFNNSLKFNNPFGRNRSHFSENMRNNLYNFVLRLNNINVSFTDQYFDELDLSYLSNGDFVYLDPPYIITTGSYNDGNRGFQNWGETQERTMYSIMNQLTKQGVRWALSNVLENKNNKHSLLEEYIESNNIQVTNLKYNYNNASYNSKGKGSKEVLITNYDVQTSELLENHAEKLSIF